MSCNVPADWGFVCDKTAVVGAAIKERRCALNSTILTTEIELKKVTCVECRSALSSSIDFALLQSHLLLPTFRIARNARSPELCIRPYCYTT